MVDIKYKLKIYPITENGEEIYHGKFVEVIKIDFIEGYVECPHEYDENYLYYFGNNNPNNFRDIFYYLDNRDGRDGINELWASVNGSKYEKIDYNIKGDYK